MNTLSLDISDLPDFQDCAEGDEISATVTIKVTKNDGEVLTGEVTEAECEPSEYESEGDAGMMGDHKPAAVIAILGPKGK